MDEPDAECAVKASRASESFSSSRGCFRLLGLVMLILCILAWIGSYWRGFFIGFGRIDPLGGWYTPLLAIANGRIALNWPNWSGDLDIGFAIPSKWRTTGFIGFYIENRYITVPLWFLTMLSALILCFLWRKSRAMAKGFPVVTLEQKKIH